MVLRKPAKCPTPGKQAYRTRIDALTAIARGAKGNSTYKCKCRWYHTTHHVRHKP